MPIVKDPSKLSILTPTGLLIPPDVRKAENDLWRAWSEFSKQTGPVMRRRMIRATFYRARLKRAVMLP